MKEMYNVNPLAESVGSFVASFVFIINLIGAAALIIFGVVTLSYDSLDSTGLILIGSGILLLITGIISWAALRIVVNISRSLLNINESIKDLKS